MDISNSQISHEDRGTLTSAYEDLLNRRQQMMDGMTSFEESPYHRGVIIDSVINGLMAHFTEFARNKEVHQQVIDGFEGPLLEGYVQDRINQAYIFFTHLPAPAMATTEVEPPPSAQA